MMMKRLLTVLYGTCLWLCLASAPALAQKEPQTEQRNTPQTPCEDRWPVVQNMALVADSIGMAYQAMQPRPEGKVVLNMLIDTDGKPIKHMIAESASDTLSTLFVSYAYGLRFTPAYICEYDKLMKVWVKVPMSFRLKETPNSKR